MKDTKAKNTYETLDTVRVPVSVPEAGVKAGDIGVVDSVYDEGKMLLVEVSRQDGSVMALLDIEVKPDGALSVVSYSTFGS